MHGHWSDCAVYNEPETAPCDCGGLELSEDSFHTFIVLRISLPGRLGDFLRKVYRESLVESHHFPTDGFVTDAATGGLINSHARIVSG